MSDTSFFCFGRFGGYGRFVSMISLVHARIFRGSLQCQTNTNLVFDNGSEF